MMNKELIIYVVVVLVFLGLFLYFSKMSTDGYGYPGYEGFRRPTHNLWHHRNYDESYSPSNRENSLYGNRFSQRGLSGGK